MARSKSGPGDGLTIRHPAPPTSEADLARYHRDMLGVLDQFARDVAARLNAARPAAPAGTTSALPETGTLDAFTFANGRFKGDGKDVWLQLLDKTTRRFFTIGVDNGRVASAKAGEE